MAGAMRTAAAVVRKQSRGSASAQRGASGPAADKVWGQSEAAMQGRR